jgi:3-dehydroquinate synthase
MKKINVNLKSNSYPVYVGNDILWGIIRKYDWNNISKILIVTDSNVGTIYKDFIIKVFKNTGKEVHINIIEAGEQSKSLSVLKKIYSFLISNNFGRDSFIVAFGGGVVGDITSFAASTYMRGVRYCQIPTTLLAAVDSSVGGKTGINFYRTKNIIGSFCQPKFVAADLNFFNTLPQEEWLCGLGEILKYCFLTDGKLFHFLKINFNKVLEKETVTVKRILLDSVNIKSSVVSKDEKEKGLRKILNLGHTFAHGFESVMNYKIKHGEAVIAGIGCAAILSNKIGMFNDEKLIQCFSLINKFHLNFNVSELDDGKLYRVMLKDKKNKKGKIKFVLIKDLGEIIIDVESDYNDIKYALNAFHTYYKPEIR